MVPYDLKNYLDSLEFQELSAFLESIKLNNIISTQRKYPDYKIRPRVEENSQEYNSNKHYYVEHFNIPHYDFALSEFLLHRDTSGFLDIEVFSFQLNSFCKTIFHRKLWNDWNLGKYPQDNFLNYIYDNWKKHQHNNEFDKLEKIAHNIFSNCDTLTEYYKEFVYNQKYEFITLNELLDLSKEVINVGIWYSQRDLLIEVYKDIDYSTTSIDTKVMFSTMSKIDIIHVNSVFNTKIYPSLKTINTKFNFIPVDDPDRRFNGFWACPKINKNVWFIPQAIIFYNPHDSN